MSVSARDRDPDDKDKDCEDILEGKDKKYYRVWRLEASREFIILSMLLVFGIGIGFYNPYQLNNNQDTIIKNQETNGKLIREFLTTFINASEQERQSAGIQLLKVLFLYQENVGGDVDDIKKNMSLPNEDFVTVNGTHAITEKGSVELPYAINITTDTQELLIGNATEVKENISNFTNTPKP